jgi:hypothetical protein
MARCGMSESRAFVFLVHYTPYIPFSTQCSWSPSSPTLLSSPSFRYLRYLHTTNASCRYDEGTAFLPVVEKKRLLPESEHWPFLALDEDGYDLPGDWYVVFSIFRFFCVPRSSCFLGVALSSFLVLVLVGASKEER